MPEQNAKQAQCPVCQNIYAVRASSVATQPRCLYCQTALDSTEVGRSLDDITGFRIVGSAEWDSPAMVYVAEKDNEKFLITLLAAGSPFYSELVTYRDRGQPDPYQSAQIPPFPGLVRIYPVVWKGDVAIAVMDFLDGKSLAQWVHTSGPLSVSGAVTIVLTALRVAKYLGEGIHLESIHPNSIQVLNSGEVRITTYAGVLLDQFCPQLSAVSLMSSMGELQQQGEWLKRFSFHYSAPEFDSHTYNIAQFTLEQLRVQKIYCLGALLFELLANQKIPTIDGGDHLVKRLEYVPIHELRPDATLQLSKIVQRMIAFFPAERYQTYDEVIADLEKLGIATKTVSFVQPSATPKAPAPANTKGQWLHRTDTDDFRRVTWGMTHDEIRVVEADNLSRVMPVAIFVDAQHQGLHLGVTYQFLMDGEELVCVGASIMPTILDFREREERPARPSSLGASYRFAQSESPESNLDGDIKATLAKLMGDQASVESSLEALSRVIGSRPLNVTKLLDTYRRLKELIHSDYGPPTVEDGPLQEDPGYVELLVDSGDFSRDQVMQHCRTSVWETERTYATLSIIPGPLGSRQVVARFWSLPHRHLFPQ